MNGHHPEPVKAKTPVRRQERKVGKLLFWAIALVPYVFSWVTLRDGYSQKARVLSLGWLTLFTIGYTGSKLKQVSKNEPTNELAQTRVEPEVPARLHKRPSDERAGTAPAESVGAARAPGAQPPVAGATVAELHARFVELKKAGKDALYDVRLPELRAQIDALPEAERKPFLASYNDVVRRASPIKAKYVAQTAKDAEKIQIFSMRETVIGSALHDLEGAEGAQADKARAQITKAMAKLEADRAATKALREKCGDVPAGEYSARTYLRGFAKDPDSIKVEGCTKPALTDRCWQMQCEYFGKNSFGGPTREVVTIWSQAGQITGSDL